MGVLADCAKLCCFEFLEALLETNKKVKRQMYALRLLDVSETGTRASQKSDVHEGVLRGISVKKKNTPQRTGRKMMRVIKGGGGKPRTLLASRRVGATVPEELLAVEMTVVELLYLRGIRPLNLQMFVLYK